MADAPFYEQPEHGWTCFHCGETLMTLGEAENHFGAVQFNDPACRIKAGEERGLVMVLRKSEQRIRELESELAAFREEDGPKDREISRLMSKHATALRRAEELGYSRGLRDATELKASDR